MLAKGLLSCLCDEQVHNTSLSALHGNLARKYVQMLSQQIQSRMLVDLEVFY